MKSSFSLSQGQTTNAPPIAVQPFTSRTRGPVSVDYRTTEALGSVRMSGAAPIVDFERRRRTANIANPVRSVRDFDAEMEFSASTEQTGLGFDVGVVPRVSVKEDGEFAQRSFGGEIRIGQNFDQRGKDVDAKSWYLFAAADGEALVYEPDDGRSFTNSMALRDQVTVGDMQAGVSFTRGAGQLSLSYIHREVEYNERGLRGQQASEDFAGVSFTIRR